MTSTASKTKTTWCRACGGTGDFFDGTESNTCGQCGGLGEHAVDVTPYGVAGDGIEAYYEPPAQKPAPDNRGLAVLVGLGTTGKHVYAGTVPPATVERRRTKNRVARRSRRINRGRR